MDLRNKWFVKQLSTQQFSGGHFTAEKRGHFAVEWWGHLRAELVGHYPRILQWGSGRGLFFKKIRIVRFCVLPVNFITLFLVGN